MQERWYMRWFIVAVLSFGLMGWVGFGHSGDSPRGGQVTTLDGPGPIRTPKNPESFKSVRDSRSRGRPFLDPAPLLTPSRSSV